MNFLFKLHQLDSRLFYLIFHNGEGPQVRKLASAISHSADGYLYLFIPAILWLPEHPGLEQLL